MKPVKIGDVSVSSIIEREGPWRAPNIMFPSATPEKLAEVMSLVPDFAYDRAQDLLCITYQTFVLRTPRATVLIDTCVVGFGKAKARSCPEYRLCCSTL